MFSSLARRFTSSFGAASALRATPLFARATAFTPARTAVTIGNCTLGKAAPAIDAKALFPNGEVKKFNLGEVQKQGKYTLLFFYPKDFTFVCPTEIIAFSERVEEFKKLNTEVVGASIDSENVHMAWVDTDRKKGGLGKMNIPLIADVDRKVSTDYGCLLDFGFTTRATFIIDDAGIVKHFSVNTPETGRNVDEYLRLISAFQHAAKHGVVCPVGWTPGKKTITPNKHAAEAFFAESDY